MSGQADLKKRGQIDVMMIVSQRDAKHVMNRTVIDMCALASKAVPRASVIYLLSEAVSLREMLDA